jgi:hypothetical protein
MKKIYLLILCMGLMIPYANSQSMVVRTADGSETTELLASVQKFSFSGENLLVLIKGGNLDKYGLSGLSKIYFKDLQQATGTTLITASDRLTVYPNPATDELYIRNLPEGTYSVSIHRLDGTIILRAALSSASPFQIGDLPKGMYFLTISGQAVKFIKL